MFVSERLPVELCLETDAGVQEIVLFHPLLFFLCEILFPFAAQVPFFQVCGHILRRSLHAEIRHQPLAAGVNRGEIPGFIAPPEGFPDGNLRSGAARLAPEAAVIGHLPRLDLQSGGIQVQVVVIRGIGDPVIVKGRLQRLDVGAGLLHGCQGKPVPQSFQHGPLLVGGPVFLYVVRKLRLAPAVNLLQSVHGPAGQQKTQQVLKAPGDGMHIVAGQIGGTDRENRLPKAADKAVMNPVCPGPSENVGAFGRAEIGLVGFRPVQTKTGHVQVQLQKSLIQGHNAPLSEIF